MTNKYEDLPYEVGKGKPPKATQFKPGQKPPKGAGRPKGAKTKNSLRKILDERVPVPGKNGKTVMMTLEQAMDKRLIHKAVQDGDMRAIALIKKSTLELEKLDMAKPLSAEEIIRQREEEREKEIHTAKIRQGIIDHLQVVTNMKKLGVIEFINGRECIAKWILDEFAARHGEEVKP